VTTPHDTAHNRPPQKRQAAALLAYDSDSSDAPAFVAPTAATQTGQLTQTPAMPTLINYAAELKSLKNEIAELCTIVTSAVAQIKSAITTIPAPRTSTSNDMDTETEMETNNPRQSVLEIQDCVNDLKHNIATFVIETKAMFQQQANLKLTNLPLKTSLT